MRCVPPFLALLCLAATCAPAAQPVPGPSAAAEAPTDLEAGLVSRLNAARAVAGLRRLAVNDDLTRLARAHSEAMRDRGFFGHDDPKRGGFAARADASGLRFTALAENVAYAENVADPAAALHAYLMDSPDHRANRLGKHFREVGIGVVAEGGKVWVTELFRTPPPYPPRR